MLIFMHTDGDHSPLWQVNSWNKKMFGRIIILIIIFGLRILWILSLNLSVYKNTKKRCLKNSEFLHNRKNIE